MTDNATPTGSGGPVRDKLNQFYTQDQVNELLSRAINVNVTQVSGGGPAPVAIERYPGIGAGYHILHFLLCWVTAFLWAIVWIIHVIVARSRWNRDQADKREAERQAREDRS